MAITLGDLKTKAEIDLGASDDRLQLVLDGMKDGSQLTSVALIGAQLEVTMNGIVVNFYSGISKDRGDLLKGVVRNFN